MHKVAFEQVQEHLDFLDKDAKSFAFASFTEKGREDKSNVSARHQGSLKQHRKVMQGYQDQFAALYVSVNSIREGGTATKDDIDRVRALFIDLDDPTATLNDVYACPLPVHRIVETSPGKHQCYWLVDGLTVEEAEGFTRWLVQKYSADKGVWDAARVFRLPGSWHLKGDPFQVRVVHTLKTARPYTIHDLDAAGVQWTPRASRAKVTDYVPPVGVDVDKLVALVNGSDEMCLDVWNAERGDFNANGLDGSAYHMAIASMLKKCRLPVEVFDVYLRAWVNRHPAGDRQGKVDRPGYIAMTWAKNTMGVALRPGETWEGWRARREGVMSLFDRDQIADDGEPDIDGLEGFLHDCSDDALAIKAANMFAGNMRFTPAFGRWHLWSGMKWTEDTTNTAKDAVRSFLRNEAGRADGIHRDLLDSAKAAEGDRAKDMTKLAGKMKTLGGRLRKSRTLTDVMQMLVLERRDGAEIVTAADAWDRHDNLLATAGGVVNLETGRMMADGRRFFCSKATAVDPAPEGAKPKRWLKFLGEVFNDDETIDFIHRFFGYALTGHTREECFVFGYGDGRNGKGVLAGTMVDIMGGYAKTVDADLFTLAGIGQHKSGVAALHGVRFALSSEIPDGAAWNLQRIKTFTGSDIIEANFMRQDKFEFKPKFSLMICANDKPALKAVDSAIRARFRFVAFPNSFVGKEDKQLKSALRAEYPAILRWAIDGAVKYLRDGLTYPEVIRAATDDYLDDADVLKNWFDEVRWDDPDSTPAVDEGWYTAGDLMQNYNSYTKAMSSKPMGKHAFLAYLRQRGMEPERKVFKYRYRGQTLVWGPFRDFTSRR